MATAVDAVRSRREINEPLLGGATTPRDATGDCARLLDELNALETIEPIFEIRTTRRIFLVSDLTGSLAEIALDATTVVTADSTPSVLLRVEVEVEQHALDRARPFVAELRAATHLEPAALSKFEFALNATGQSIPSRPK
jgi:inorganic triphosphatase YgiF